MTGVGQPSAADVPTLLTKATEAVQKATKAVQTTGRTSPMPSRRVAGPVLPRSFGELDAPSAPSVPLNRFPGWFHHRAAASIGRTDLAHMVSHGRPV